MKTTPSRASLKMVSQTYQVHLVAISINALGYRLASLYLCCKDSVVWFKCQFVYLATLRFVLKTACYLAWCYLNGIVDENLSLTLKQGLNEQKQKESSHLVYFSFYAVYLKVSSEIS